MDPTDLIPEPARSYCGAVATTAREALTEQLAGVYAIGSLALDDWIPGSSDIDVAVVTRGRIGRARLASLAEALAGTAPSLPARKLELVVYRASRLAEGDTTFSMNLNVDRGGRVVIELDPLAVPAFWFVIDMAIARRNGIALFGPGAEDLIGGPPESEVRSALRAALVWHLAGAAEPGANVLASCRALHYLRRGSWTGKSEAARWVARELRADEPELARAIDQAAADRASGRRPARAADPFVARELHDRALSAMS